MLEISADSWRILTIVLAAAVLLVWLEINLFYIRRIINGIRNKNYAFLLDGLAITFIATGFLCIVGYVVSKRRDLMGTPLDSYFTPVTVGLTCLLVGSIMFSLQKRTALEKPIYQVFDSNPEAIITKNADEIIQYVNNEARHLFGFTSNELIGQPITKIVSESDSKLGIEFANSNSRHGREIEVTAKNGERMPAYVVVSKRFTANADIEYIKQFKDLRQLYEREQALQEKVDTFESIHRIIRHDMKTDAEMILDAVEIFDDEMTVEQKKVFQTPLEQVENGINSMFEMILAIKEVTTLGKVDKAKLNFKDSDLNQEIQKVVKGLKGRQNVHIDNLGKAQILTNWFPRIVKNIVENGLKYNDKEEPQLKIYRKGAELIFEDNGIGFPVEQFEELKQAGVRGKNALGKEGQGIGLKILTDAVELHGWKLKVESKIGQWTKFKVQMKLII